jgi:diguanylate cyclase (GGDEF)-like protein
MNETLTADALAAHLGRPSPGARAVERIGVLTGANLVQLGTSHSLSTPRWTAPGRDLSQESAAGVQAVFTNWVASCPSTAHSIPQVATVGDLTVAIVCGQDCPNGALMAVRPASAPWTEADLAGLQLTVDLISWPGEPSGDALRQRGLDELVTEVAGELMGVTAQTVESVRLAVTHRLADFLGVDTAFLRHNDHGIRASRLVAEWPPRPFIPTPDPLGIVSFDSGDPTFDLLEFLSEPLIRRPDPARADYQKRVQDASGQGEVSMACVPLIDGAVTIGVLGFVNFRDREWLPAEINALNAIASLMTQVEARVQAEHTLQFNAFHDDLTGLPNRRSFLDHLQAIADRGESLALIFLDMDRLKAMNDTLGHVAGDDLIRAVAHRMKDALGPTNFAARLAGDEFVGVLSPCADVAEAMRVATELLRAVEAPLQVAGHILSRTASIGLTFHEHTTSSVSELLHQADAALLSAKSLGGNEIAVFNDDMRAQMEWRSDLELHVREAISSQQLQLNYQPEFDLRTGAVLAVEALVRWRHPMHGLIPPDSFIDIVEQTNLASELGGWVINEACAQLARWNIDLPDLDIAMRVNVSPAQLVSDDIVNVVRRALEHYKLKPGSLCLEITERSLVRDIDSVIVIADALHALGVKLAIDDFGTGYSSYAQLRSLPVDILKVDRSFIAALGRDPRDDAILSSIASLAAAFSMELVAEGVEAPETVEALLSHGCHRAQGYLMCRPLAPERVFDVLRDGGVDMAALGVRLS